MTHIDIYSMTGEKISTKELLPNVCDEGNINYDLIQEYVVMYNANKRINIAHTKTRGEVAGSGRKLYNQKGTGNARVGDARSPIRKKGGVAFGPRNTKNYSKNMNVKMKQKALLSAFILQLHQSSFLGLDSYNSTLIKTNNAYNMLNSLPLSGVKTLIVFNKENDILKKSIRNISKVSFTSAMRTNAFELLNAKRVIFVGDALEVFLDRIS